ncbi:hypothetical protein PAXRUDRAFT_771011 [Paxillus rubicundulus Ve08.2h10]|uniref:Uncharacterized protein n=1 Tax=Paxillus rubicundulus Ve08.2h10 TaxID=930991 RepID=A0A0D0DFM6_9AGAM|nr:hypothetical protein PAXRUDRAFT_771011 [Paxillus rubicundulus Ve08.2h10]
MLVPPNSLFPVFSLVGALLVAIPRPRHSQAISNLRTSLLMVRTEVACLVQFTNSIRWNHNVENWAPVWCDLCSLIRTRLLAVGVALATTALCVNRRLYMIVTLHQRRNEKTFDVLFELYLGLVVPGFAYIVQKYRYYIFEDIGCLQAVANVGPAFPIVYMLPLLVGSVYAAYAFFTLWKTIRRKQHGPVLDGITSTGWSQRLMAHFHSVFVLTSISIVLLATESPVPHWPGWIAIHSINGFIVIHRSGSRTVARPSTWS